MADYKTHLTGGAVVGAALGCYARWGADVSISAAILSGCLCTIGGILPDIDSKTSTSFKRCLSVVAGISALLLVSRLRDFPLDVESVVMVGGGTYLVISFFIGGLIRRFTVHRGMCHSIPMAVIAAEIIYLLSSGAVELRVLKAFAIFLGVLVHLSLDEFYSFEVVDKKALAKTVRIKKSFGTALKVIDFENVKSTVFFFVLICCLTEAIFQESRWTQSEAARAEKQEIFGKRAVDRVRSDFPLQFDLAVVEWVAENQMVLEPGSSDNAKWKELESMFEKNATRPASASGSKQIKMGRSKLAQGSPTQDSPSLSILDQINWRSRHPRPTNDSNNSNDR